MKHRVLSFLLLIVLLSVSAQSALAQGPTPPQDPRLLQEQSYWFPGGPQVEVQKPAGSRPAASDLPVGPALALPGPSAASTSPIVNGSFEQGRVGWSESSSNGYVVVVPDAPEGVTPHSGSWIAWLGDDNNEHTVLSQSNLFIASPTGLALSYWIGSGDDCGYDYGYVKINGSTVHTWDLCYNTNTYGWRSLYVDLSTYHGLIVTLTIEVVTDVGVPSGLLIDDVSFYRTFADVAVGYWAEDFVERLYNAGVTGGCGNSPARYCPEGVVTRDQMAVFLLKGIHGSAYTPPLVGSTTGFADVPITYWSAPFIKQLAAEGITAGCSVNPPGYCPQTQVSRAQMAVFLLRAKYGSAYMPPDVGASTGFGDVPTSYWAAPFIKQLVVEGITSGCGNGNYCPDSPVTRAQMAVFLVKTFALP